MLNKPDIRTRIKSFHKNLGTQIGYLKWYSVSRKAFNQSRQNLKSF